MRPRRVLFNVPGSEEKFINKGAPLFNELVTLLTIATRRWLLLWKKINQTHPLHSFLFDETVSWNRICAIICRIINGNYLLLPATTLDLDVLVFDFEDGVALNKKAEARAKVVNAIKNINFGRAEKSIRINSIRSGFE